MKVTANQYAKALYELTIDTDNAGADLAVKNMLRVLRKNAQMKLKNEIVKKFEEISNFKNGIIEAEVKSCEKLDSELVDKLSRYIKEKYQAEKVVIRNLIDEKIGGGVIVRVGDEIFDASVAGSLKKMRKDLSS